MKHGCPPPLSTAFDGRNGLCSTIGHPPALMLALGVLRAVCLMRADHIFWRRVMCEHVATAPFRYRVHYSSEPTRSLFWTDIVLERRKLLENCLFDTDLLGLDGPFCKKLCKNFDLLVKYAKRLCRASRGTFITIKAVKYL